MANRRLPRRNQLGLPVGRPDRYAPRIPVPTAGPLARLGGALAGQTGANHAPDVLVPGNLAGAALTAGRVATHAPISLLGAGGAGTGTAAGGAGRKPAGTFPSAKPPPTVDPYAPQTPEQIAAQVAAAVKAQTDPVLKQIADSNAARAAAAQQAITGYTTAFGPALQQLAGIGTAGYQTGIQSQAAIDAALQQSLTGGGTAAASELGAKLAQINAPQADQQAAAQAAIGAGSGNAAFATGSAALSALNAQLASAENVATKQPGIAALYGGQATRDLQAQASRDLADQQGQITAQVPGLIASLTQNAQDTARSQANTNRTFNEGVREFGVNRADRIKASRASIAADRSKPSPSFTTQHNPWLTNSYGEVLTDVKGNPLPNPGYVPPKTTAGKPDPLAKPNLALTKANNSQVVLNGHGKPFLVGGKTLKYAPPAAATKPRTRDDLKVAASTGGWDPKTGALSPAMREGIQAITGIDPGPTATRQQMVAAGLLPKPSAPKAPKVTGTSSSSKFIVTLNPDGSVRSRQPNPNYRPPAPSETPAGKAAKAKQSALKTADSTALRIVQGGSKKTGVYGKTPKTNAFGDVVKGPDGKPVMVRSQTGERYSASYYETIHRIEAAVQDTLGPYMPQSEIIRFAQRYANQYYPAGKGGRPLTAAQAEKAAPTRPRFPKPKGPTKPRRPKVANPRGAFDRQFPLGVPGV